jgi:hypothetical protein
MPTTERSTLLPAESRRTRTGHEPEQACRIWIDEHGQVLDCCEHTPGVFGYRPENLKGQHISLLLPHLAGCDLLKKGLLDPSLAFLCHCSVPFTTISVDGECGSCALFAYLVNLSSGVAVALIVRPLPPQHDPDRSTPMQDRGYLPASGQAKVNRLQAREAAASMSGVSH